MQLACKSVGGITRVGLFLCVLAFACHSDDVVELASETPVVHPVPAPESPLLALTPTEYNNTVRDLLGMPMSSSAWPQPPAIASSFVPEEGEKSGLFGSAPIQTEPWPWSFPSEVGVEHFEKIATKQVASPYSV
ncbi:MAG TPA: DUF1587 domain-containing protein, partial [Myxococcales bacterium]|nr:DUF1587 domain-containing protein [Myxococcales bacterium]